MFVGKERILRNCSKLGHFTTVEMSSHKRKNTKSPGSEFECGLTIPKFLQPYKDMLGNDSVFRNQIRQERENAFADKEAEQLGFNDVWI